MRLDNGAAGAMLKISDYNGAANDPVVTLEFFGKAWMPLDDAGVQPTPRKDGTDTWTVYPDTVGFISAGPHAIQRDSLAYVTNHTLVAHLLDATIALRPETGVNDNPLVIEVHDAFMTAKLVSTDRGFRIESAMLGGRWPSERILKSFATLADVNGSICKNNGSLPSLEGGRVRHARHREQASRRQSPGPLQRTLVRLRVHRWSCSHRSDSPKPDIRAERLR